MKCEICGIRPAGAMIAMITNGSKTARHICPVCMEELRQPGAYTLFLSLLSVLLGEADNVCPNCGRSFRDVRRNGRMGCAQCYDAFGAQLAPVLDRLFSVQQRTEREVIPNPSNTISKIDSLREEMFNAVSAEEYERAAALRDKIRALQREEKEK